MQMIRYALLVAVASVPSASLSAQDADSLAGKRVVFLGDSITQAGGYVGLTTYYLEKLNPKKDFDFLGLGLASETLSGLSEDGHAGGKFPGGAVRVGRRGSPRPRASRASGRSAGRTGRDSPRTCRWS